MSKVKFNPETPLYTSVSNPHHLEELPQILTQLIARGKPIVVFVHGRGHEPNKSLKGASFTKGLAVPKIELGYNASALMFSWDSKFSSKPSLSIFHLKDRTLPLKQIPAAAESLHAVLSSLSAYYVDHPTAPRPTLLAHSMGTIVVQRTVEKNFWPPGPAIFKQIVLSEPDADDVGHNIWLDRLARQETVYVTFNRDDKVLKRSQDDRPDGMHALGLGTQEPLAAHATYIDLTAMGAIGSEEDDDHEVFGKGAMNGQLYVCQFFEQALRGETVVLDTDVNVESIDRGVVYRLKAKFQPHAPCLQQPSLPE